MFNAPSTAGMPCVCLATVPYERPSIHRPDVPLPSVLRPFRRFPVQCSITYSAVIPGALYGLNLSLLNYHAAG